jgi:hypothetical protein
MTTQEENWVGVDLLKTDDSLNGMSAGQDHVFDRNLYVTAYWKEQPAKDQPIKFVITNDGGVDTGSHFTVIDKPETSDVAMTDSNGKATASKLTAGSTIGPFTVKVSFPGSPSVKPVSYHLRVINP